MTSTTPWPPWVKATSSGRSSSTTEAASQERPRPGARGPRARRQGGVAGQVSIYDGGGQRGAAGAGGARARHRSVGGAPAADVVDRAGGEAALVRGEPRHQFGDLLRAP